MNEETKLQDFDIFAPIIREEKEKIKKTVFSESKRIERKTNRKQKAQLEKEAEPEAKRYDSAESVVSNNEEIILENWKGKGSMKIFEEKNNYRIVEARTNKEKGHIEYTEKNIPTKNVEIIKKIIEKKCEKGIMYGYKYLVNALIEETQFHTIEGMSKEGMSNVFNGGILRSKYYFPYFYYPLKILEKKGTIQYLGRGGIIKQ